MKICITAIILLNFTICFGQVDSLTLPFVSYWSKGDSYNFKITKIHQRWKENELIKNDSSSYLVNFIVADSSETNYTIKWRYKTDFRALSIPEKLVEKFSKYQMTEVIYKTSEVGEFIGIENWQDISSMMKELFNDLTNELYEAEETQREAINKALQPLIGIYQSKEGIEQLVFTELHFFHFPFGLEYSVEEPIQYEEELPNMFGGKPIRGDSKLYFEKVDFENLYCKMIQEMKLNPEDTKQLVSTLFKRMGLQDMELEKAMKAATLDITDYNTYEYYYYPGIPIKIETHRESLIDIGNEKGKRIDKTKIELIE